MQCKTRKTTTGRVVRRARAPERFRSLRGVLSALFRPGVPSLFSTRQQTGFPGGHCGRSGSEALSRLEARLCEYAIWRRHTEPNPPARTWAKHSNVSRGSLIDTACTEGVPFSKPRALARHLVGGSAMVALFALEPPRRRTEETLEVPPLASGRPRHAGAAGL